MSICQNCGASMASDDVFCRSCGTKRKETQSNSATENKASLFLKYSNYLDPNTLFNIAYAKETGIVQSDFPNEAELIYEHLAIKDHTESMFRYAMMQMKKEPSDNDTALKWLKLAAAKGHEASKNYLKMYAAESEERASAVSQAPTVNGGQLSGEEIFSRMENSTVEIIAVSNERSAFRSSGFVVSNKGFVVTNAHAILDEFGRVCKNIAVKLGEKVLPAMPVAFGNPADGKNDSLDIALLFVPDSKFGHPAELGNSSGCRNGQKVYLIGNSLGCGTCITSGIISDATRDMPGLSYPYIMTDAAANHGNSGGPLLNEQGQVIGVLVAGMEKVEGMNYAIPIDMVKGFFEYLAKNTDLNSSVLGDLVDTSKPSNMSAFTDKLFTGIHLFVDIIAFVLSII